MFALQCTKFLVFIPTSVQNGSMASRIINTAKIDAKLLKQLSRTYETGISISDISEQLGMDKMSVKRLLRLLGYAAAD